MVSEVHEVDQAVEVDLVAEVGFIHISIDIFREKIISENVNDTQCHIRIQSTTIRQTNVLNLMKSKYALAIYQNF